MDLSKDFFKRLFVLVLISMVALSFTVSSVSAKSKEVVNKNDVNKEILSPTEAENYLNAVEETEVYKDLFSSQKLLREDEDGNKASAIGIELNEKESEDFNKNIVIVESKVEDTGIIALLDRETHKLFSVSTIEDIKTENGMTVTEYDGETGEILLQNKIVENEVVKDDNTIEPMKIKKGSYWWKVLCNLSTGGSCSLGCLSLIAVPGGYPVCVSLCSAFAGGAAC
ncbi:hypothetical protein RVS70_01640 [Virgibacillus sp. M23]|uniref:hypothetical protein n=1 Tax=Virgibacillus sp. M23 TaxID=3079030 RepID=UPI002A917AE9|nr:hypothetical protein [Virgibacillus sp. M23]MDY7042902.1 hypothetical protein [Virgibacillus sp. M23]